MGARHHALTGALVLAALVLLGFDHKQTRGSHAHYVRQARGRFRKVTVDDHLAPFSQDLIGSMAFQAGITKAEFYAAVNGAIPTGWPD